jgi:hypothetical protein
MTAQPRATAPRARCSANRFIFTGPTNYCDGV